MPDYIDIDKTFRPRVTRYIARLVGESEAEDLAQTTMIKVERGLAAFKGGSKLSTWIYRIATNTALDWQKSSHGRRFGSTAPLHDPGLERVPATNRGVDASAIRKEMKDCIRRLLDEMTEKNRVALVLSEFEERTAREIAGVLEISVENAKIRIHRSREALRRLMTCRCHLYHDEDFNLACDPLS